MSLDISVLTGPALDAALDDLAWLRLRVFREWPYLYDGHAAYERRYLASYAANDRAILVGAFRDRRLVGAATGMPLEDHDPAFSVPLMAAGYPAADVFYCAESVLLPEFRGQGAGHGFFDLREAHARRLGRKWSSFCAAMRPSDDPRRPADYSPLDPFWQRRGYAEMPGVVAHFPWRDLGAAKETEKPLQFWIRRL